MSISLAAAALKAVWRAPDHKSESKPAPAAAVRGNPSEVLFLDRCGWEPLGLVCGAAVFHVGLVGWPSGNTEVTQLSNAMYGAREKALAGLVREASRIGADGVVNASIDIHFMQDERHLPRFVALGTAIRRAGRRPNVTESDATPFVTTIKASELGLLNSSGFRPLGLVMGSCVYHVGRQAITGWSRNISRNTELTGISTAFYDARELAMTRLQEEARTLAAAGVVGVTTGERSHVWGSRVIEFFAMGTAVASVDAPDGAEPPRVVLPLNDGFDNTDPARIIQESEATHPGSPTPAASAPGPPP